LPPDTTTYGHRLHRIAFPGPHLGLPVNPALLKRERERAISRQNRMADAITRFAGSMLFVYVHIVWFALWIGLGLERYPYGLLTMIVSLEAIFLSTFVLISQNRELLTLSNQILALTEEVRSLADSFANKAEITELSQELHSLAGVLRGSASPSASAADPEQPTG